MRFLVLLAALLACSQEPHPAPRGPSPVDLRQPTCFPYPVQTDAGVLTGEHKTVCAMPCKSDEECPHWLVCHPIGKRCLWPE